MGGAMLFGIISGALSAFQSFSQAQAQAAAQRNQARLLAANAQVARQNSALEAAQAEQEAQNQERQKTRLRREFRDTQAANRVSLGAGNVDMATGSALDMELGNIDRFAADMGDNAYAAALRKWQAREQARLGEEQATIMEENASWLQKSSGNPLTSLLTAGISGFGGFTRGYGLAGGSLGTLFGGKKKNAKP